MSRRILTKTQINRLLSIALRSRATRAQWLAGIPEDQVGPERGAVLPRDKKRQVQMLGDLECFNVKKGEADTEPLRRMVENLRRHHPRPGRLADHEDKILRRIGAPPAAKVVLQKAVLRDETVSFDFLALGAVIGRSVCHLTVSRSDEIRPNRSGAKTFGTGFLIGPRHLLTNHHVIAARTGESAPSKTELDAQATGIIATWDFDRPDTLAACPSQKTHRAVMLNEALDFAVLELDAPATSKRLGLRVAPEPLALEEGKPIAANVIQHPWGYEKRCAIRSNIVHEVETDIIRYFSDTEQGSSGSPVFNDKWEVVALHKGSERRRVHFQGEFTTWLNIGIPIHRVLTELKADAALWAAIQAGDSVPI